MNLLKDQFLLNPDITFLNFGSFGACPKPVMQKYQALQMEMEAEPVHFITNKGITLLNESKEALARYINCDEQNLIYVPNPSHSVNIVANSL